MITKYEPPLDPYRTSSTTLITFGVPSIQKWPQKTYPGPHVYVLNRTEKELKDFRGDPFK